MHTFLSFPRLARDSSVLVFLGPIREQARSWPFRILTVVGTYSHGTAASVASGFSAFAPLPSAPSLRPPSPSALSAPLSPRCFLRPLSPNSRTPTLVLGPCRTYDRARHLDFGLSRTLTLVPGPSRACRPARLWRKLASQTIRLFRKKRAGIFAPRCQKVSIFAFDNIFLPLQI